MKVEEAGGRRHEIFVPFVKSYPSHPMSNKEVDRKVMELMIQHLGSGRAEEVIDMVNRTDQLNSVMQLLQLIAR